MQSDVQCLLDGRQRRCDDLHIQNRHEHADAHHGETSPHRCRYGFGRMIFSLSDHVFAQMSGGSARREVDLKERRPRFYSGPSLPPGMLLVAILATDDSRAACSVRRLMHPENGLCPANGLCAAVSGFVVRRLGIRACTTLIVDERENVPRTHIGIEGLRKGRHRDDGQGSRSDESLSHESSFLMLLGARPSRFLSAVHRPFLDLLASTTDVAPTHAAINRSAMFAYLLMQEGVKTFP